ncbi:MAG TPA: SNF2-related protein, partial [Cellvibrionaceae bacterium]|nr:SNF2-related protein [Cellvibrionaceae bacterium]
MFTPHQSAYFAYWLTQTDKIKNQVSRVMASARVDMNPHQVEAAWFALKSPLEKGVLLADEVGLGKTIEASLVMAQKWAEHKRNILLVVPASLRKQWEQELQDKFELPSTIIDSKVAQALKKDGCTNPFFQSEKIIICSYEYLAQQKDKALLISWDLVVFDEAHKLRNVYQKQGSKRAKAIVEATRGAASRVLLSATPMQNNLIELYGLSQVIDPHFFGDEKSFRALYVNRQKNKDVLQDLKKRITPLCHRTLRRQVQEEGGIMFTNRYAITQDFTPTAEEWELYTQLSEYLRLPYHQTIDPKAKHLVSIGLRKILASSSFAVAETLKNMLARLAGDQAIDDEAINDLDAKDDWLDINLGAADTDEELDQDEAEPADLIDAPKRPSNAKYKQEFDLLHHCEYLASKIDDNAKGQALIDVLEKAMAATESLGGQRKAVVFTESCRTQQYLYTLLSKNGYADRIVLLNGTNADTQSQSIYNEWKKRHQGTARISGSKPADMKAALVEKFKSTGADILISTEAGGEGINLQFCSLLINYDLPWNPQKVEQRIGRVHRYGQKNDVVIVNFVNRKNPADERVFNLLHEKLKLFEGVFGASDEVLGAISSDIDIEKRIYEIYQKCESADDIQTAFDKLQEDLSPTLSVREASARETLLANFDRDVVANLKNIRDESQIFLQDYEQGLLDLAKAELPEARFEDTHFYYKDKRYDLRWNLAELNGSEFFRLHAVEHLLAWELVKKAQGRYLPPAILHFNYSQLRGQYAALKPYIGKSGVIAALRLRFSFNKGNSHATQVLVVANTDQGETLSQDHATHLLCIPATGTPLPDPIDASVLQQQIDSLIAGQTLIKEQELDTYLEQETEKLERWAQDRRDGLQQRVKELDDEIRQFKKEARLLATTKDKIDAKRALRILEQKRDDAFSEYHLAKKDIEAEEDR